MPKLERRGRLKTEKYYLPINGSKEQSAPSKLRYYTTQGKPEQLVNIGIFEVFSLICEYSITQLKLLVSFNTVFFV
jgi:hypothetical protein